MQIVTAAEIAALKFEGYLCDTKISFKNQTFNNDKEIDKLFRELSNHRYKHVVISNLTLDNTYVQYHLFEFMKKFDSVTYEANTAIDHQRMLWWARLEQPDMNKRIQYTGSELVSLNSVNQCMLFRYTSRNDIKILPAPAVWEQTPQAQSQRVLQLLRTLK